MKKIIMYVLVFALSAVILTGCRGPQNETTTNKPTTTAAPTTKPTTAPSSSSTQAPSSSSTQAPSSSTEASGSSGAAGRMPMMPRY